MAKTCSFCHEVFPSGAGHSCEEMFRPVNPGNEARETEKYMERKYEVGQHVIYFDQFGKPHKALVTIWWGVDLPGYTSDTGEPGCNIVLVSGDELKKDEYGRQIERETSIVHKSKQPAHGKFWCWPSEL